MAGDGYNNRGRGRALRVGEGFEYRDINIYEGDVGVDVILNASCRIVYMMNENLRAEFIRTEVEVPFV